MNGTGFGGALQARASGFIRRLGKIKNNFEPRDAAWRRGGHVLVDFHFESREVVANGPRLNAHDGRHAGHERGGAKIRRGKRRTAALIIFRRIGFDNRARRPVHGPAMQVAEIFPSDGNHAANLNRRSPTLNS